MVFRNFLFDLDGTLIDSEPGIIRAASMAMAEVLPTRSIPIFRPLIGSPIRHIFREALDEQNEEVLDRLIASYRKFYDNDSIRFSSLYKGVESTLQALSEDHCLSFVVTNKPLKPTQCVLAHLGIYIFFSEIFSPDSTQPPFKNKTSMTAALITKAGLDSRETVFIGDSEDDGRAASECGIPFIAVSYGYGNAAKRSQFPFIKAISHISDILTN